LPSRPRLLVLALVLATSLAVAACGGGGGGGGAGSSKDATSLVDTAFKHSIKSATIAIDVDAQINGISSLKGPLSLKVTGPYASSGGGKLPQFDFKASILGGGQSVPLAIRSTGDNLFLQLQGNWYEFGKDAVAKINQQLAQQKSQTGGKSLSTFGINPLSWLRDAKNAGDTTLGGDKVSHVTATLDVAKLLDDLNSVVSKASVSGSTKPPQLTASQKQQIQNIVKDPHIDVYVAKADQTLRRLAATVNFSVPNDQRAKLQGLSGGTIKFSIEFSNVGQSISVSAPSNAQPLTSLAGLLGGSSLGAGSSGSSSSGSGSSSAPSTKQVQAYAKCLQKAGGDASAISKCAAILNK
jgi:hypothetical protein